MVSMRLRVIVFLCTLPILCGCSISNKNHSDVLENSIGKLISLHDKQASYQHDDNPFGSAKTFLLFKELYVSEISKKSEFVRSDYFWSSMWHLGFDGDYMKEFQEIVYQDLGEKFIDRLQDYVDKETQLGRSKRKLFLTQKVLFGLNEIHEREKKHKTYLQ